MLQLKDNPPMTLPGAGPLEAEAAPWNIAYTKPRQEKALAHDLCRKGIPYFLPMKLRQTVSGGRRRQNLYPLFGSYLFYAGDEETRAAALKTERILGHLDLPASQQDQFRHEIAALHQGLAAAPERFDLHPRLVAGGRVRVIAGAMKDVEGVVLRADRATKLYLNVTILGSSGVVEIHPDLVEPIGGAADHRPGVIEYQVGEGAFVATQRRNEGGEQRAASGERRGNKSSERRKISGERRVASGEE